MRHHHNVIDIPSGDDIFRPEHFGVKFEVMIDKRHILSFQRPFEISDPFLREILRDSEKIHLRWLVTEWEVRGETITFVSGMITGY
jgi:hypothetical protein